MMKYFDDKQRTTIKVLAIRVFPPEKFQGKLVVLRRYECSREAKEKGFSKIEEVPIVRVQRKGRKETCELEVDLTFALGYGRYPRLEPQKIEVVMEDKTWGVWGQIPLSPEQAKKLGEALLFHAKPSKEEDEWKRKCKEKSRVAFVE